MAKTTELIKIRGARQNNLKNVNIDLPKYNLICLTGVSGSGKSSLAFDTLYAEGQRRYVESLSSYARQFLGIMSKPDVDLIEGLSPAISIDQKTVSHNPRSTVGTVTEIYDYFRLLYARTGHPHCPICGREIASQSTEQIVDHLQNFIYTTAKDDHIAKIFILSPVVKDKKGEFSSLFENLKSKGYRHVRIDGIIKNLNDDFVLIKTNKHTIDVVVDRISISKKDLKNKILLKNLRSRLNDAVEQASKLSDGLVIAGKILDKGFDLPDYPKEFEDHLYSQNFACPVDNISLPEIEPRTFSFNSPHGACHECNGLGKKLVVDTDTILAQDLSIKEGGIIPFATIFEHNTWLARLILKVCQSNNIDATTAIKNLSPEQLDIVLNGTSERVYEVEGNNRQGRYTKIYETYGGVTAELTKRHEQTTSDHVRIAIEKYMKEIMCPQCNGARLKPSSLSITIDDKSINDIVNFTVTKLIDWCKSLQKGNKLNTRESQIAELILKEIITRLTFLEDVGLDYLNLARSAATLSGGEAQRIRLASQIGSGLSGVLYVLDEPTIGLHPRDNSKLISTLKKLRNLGNTVVVVEHDRDVMLASDVLVDFGPGAGLHGGALVAQGTPKQIEKNKHSLTGKYLSGKKKINFPLNGTRSDKGELKLTGAGQYNLKNIDVNFPLGKLVSVTGVSGSGKSTLVVETLYHALNKKLNNYYRHPIGEYKDLEGYENVDKAILIDQSPIGRTPRSNPATYTKIFDYIRDVYANTRYARGVGFKKGRFSFNVKGGRCEECEGQGRNKIEMQFMPDIWVECEICHGARYNSQTLEVEYNGKNIADVLNMTAGEAIEFFHVYEPIRTRLETLKAVGLQYMKLGQSATTLSGGEAQRIKLAAELGKRSAGKTVYILDEPTTGLHFADLEKLMKVLKILVSRGNTVIVVEHNLDVIKNSDWIIDLGPEGGEHGGMLVAQGKPKEIANKNTYTGQYLAKVL